MELVSVVVPVYNADKTIECAIKSLECQTYTNIEIIIVNDGSNDDTDGICQRLVYQDSRVKYFTIDNGGVSKARNTGLSHCSGKYIAFLDSDDQMESMYIEKMVAHMDDDVDLVCCGYKTVSANNEFLFEQVPSPIKKSKNEAYIAIENLQACQCMNVLWNKLFKTSIIRDNNIVMNVNLSMGEDLLFVIDYIKNMDGTIVVISDTGYRYAMSANGLQANFCNNVKLRVEQLNEVKELYRFNNFPLDGFYLEALRTIYILLMENGETIEGVKKVLLLEICKEVRGCQIYCKGKYKVFHYLLKINNAHIIVIFIRLFTLLKRIQGRSYKWKE